MATLKINAGIEPIQISHSGLITFPGESQRRSYSYFVTEEMSKRSKRSKSSDIVELEARVYATQKTFFEERQASRLKLSPKFNSLDKTPEGVTGKELESERRLAEYLAARYDTQYLTPVSRVKSNPTKAEIEIYIDRRSCPFCLGIPSQVRAMLPQAKVIWIDSEGDCY